MDGAISEQDHEDKIKVAGQQWVILKYSIEQ
jgi:hypothetical protein